MRCLLFLFVPTLALAADRPDIVIADFEGENYGDWKTTGTAFGDKPARGTLPGQMPVTGYLGKGLVNSFHGGDASTGTLTSPGITIERKFISFLIGGGRHEKTRIDLLVGGKVVRTATGPNDKPGGSEQLDWHSWDVAEFAGKKAVIQIIDGETGGWGHINIDHIIQSDKKKAAELLSREFTIEKGYLHLPVKNGAAKKRMSFTVDGKIVREFEIELAEGKPDFLVFADVSAFKGKTLKVAALLMSDSKALDAIVASDDVPDKETLYEEKLRPRFHFTSRRGWLNDPNGLVFDGKDYHLFYQHNPYGKEWGNMHWGHATSPDLVHWKELGEALYPKSFGDWAFSGSAVMDKGNTSGWGTKDNPAMVLAFTSTGRGECIAYSTDKGRTWTEYEKNPVVKHAGRDPRLVWYEPGKHWVMAVYDETGGKKRIAFHTSPDLKTWTYQSAIDGFFECPDLFEIPVDGSKTKEKKWILYAADGKYMIGTFDGKKFTKESGKHQLWYGNFYAVQTFSNAPDGRRIQIGWANGVTFPGMPFNQQMTVPVHLFLLNGKDGPRLIAEPVGKLERLRGERLGKEPDLNLTGKPITVLENVDVARIRFAFDLPAKGLVHASLCGLEITYDPAKSEVTCGKVVAPVKSNKGRIQLDCYLDRGSIEIFVDAVVISVAHVAPAKAPTLTVAGEGGKLFELEWWPLKSAWK